MIIITGEFIAKTGSFDKALSLSKQHAEYSRTEQGCISHDVFIDPENPNRLFFFEQWTDQEAITSHFAQDTSQAFVNNISPLAMAPASLSVFTAEKIR